MPSGSVITPPGRLERSLLPPSPGHRGFRLAAEKMRPPWQTGHRDLLERQQHERDDVRGSCPAGLAHPWPHAHGGAAARPGSSVPATRFARHMLTELATVAANGAVAG